MAQEKKLEQHNGYQRFYYEHRTVSENHRMVPVADLSSSPYIANHLQRLIRYAHLQPDEKIIDVGCGMGKYTIPLAKSGFAMEGLDLSPVLLETLRQHAGDDLAIPTHCADILHPPEALYGQYDVVMGSFMLHHLIDIDSAFTQMARLLNGHGRMVFIDVNPFCPLYYLQITLSPSMRWAAEKGLFALTPTNLRRSLTQAGFSNIRIEKFGITPPAIRNSRYGRDVDNAFDAIGWLNPFSAFQLIYADKD